MQPSKPARRVAILAKGYPRLSETFVVQEILGLERRGFDLQIWSLRRPTDRVLHPMHAQVAAPRLYLPEYLHQEPWRVLKAVAAARRRPGLLKLLGAVWRDLRRDPSANRLRRVGQALCLARELDGDVHHIHVHFLHTPASVARYAALLTGRTWSFSAHAKDIWTLPDWEKAEKLASAAWGVTCTAEGLTHLRALAPEPDRVSLVYHGLDLARFPDPPGRSSGRDGSDPADPVRIVSVGRAVPKKGLDDLVVALASLPGDLHWRFVHVGGGPDLAALRAQAERLGIDGRLHFMGPRSQPDVISLLREADVFVLPCKTAGDGDRDGLPNVLMEAASQRLAIVSTTLPTVAEFVRAGQDGVLVPPGEAGALSNALNGLCRDPAAREAAGRSAWDRLRRDFSAEPGFDAVAALLDPASRP